MLSLLHIGDTNNNKRKENFKFHNLHYHIQYIKDVQHKNINMTWDRKLPRHPVAAEMFEMMGRNTILLHYHYRVDPELGKVFCVIRRISCACPYFVPQLDKDW